LELAGELNRHGYRFNARKLDRVLTALERAGYLTAFGRSAPNMGTKVYKATAKGWDFVVLARVHLQKLAEELLA
jgi:hypothetical protein